MTDFLKEEQGAERIDMPRVPAARGTAADADCILGWQRDTRQWLASPNTCILQLL